MKRNSEFQKLIAEYECIAPEMLININKAENKNDILEVIYNQFVVPAVSLVQQRKE